MLNQIPTRPRFNPNTVHKYKRHVTHIKQNPLPTNRRRVRLATSHLPHQTRANQSRVFRAINPNCLRQSNLNASVDSINFFEQPNQMRTTSDIYYGNWAIFYDFKPARLLSTCFTKTRLWTNTPATNFKQTSRGSRIIEINFFFLKSFIFKQ